MLIVQKPPKAVCCNSSNNKTNQLNIPYINSNTHQHSYQLLKTSLRFPNIRISGAVLKTHQEILPFEKCDFFGKCKKFFGQKFLRLSGSGEWSSGHYLLQRTLNVTHPPQVFYKEVAQILRAPIFRATFNDCFLQTNLKSLDKVSAQHKIYIYD